MENGLELTLQCGALYGYSFLRAGIPLVESVSVLCKEEPPLDTVELELSFDPPIFSPWKKKLGRLRRGERTVIPHLCDGLGEALLGNHGGSVNVRCLLRTQEGIAAQELVRVPLCDLNEFCGWDSYLSLCACFVTPDALSVSRLAEELSERRAGGTYFTKKEIAAWLEQAYELLRRREITYSIHGFSAERKGQHLRFPSQCLRERSANGAELAFLFASVAEAAGLDAVVIFFSSSVMVGVYTEDHAAVSSELLDPLLLQEQLRQGSLTVLDPSCLCYGTNFPFAICEKNARTALEQGEDFLGAVDVAKAREEGVRGIPSELYERVSEEYAGRLIPSRERGEGESVSQREKKSLLGSACVKALLDVQGEELPLTAAEADACSYVKGEAFASSRRACMGVGRLEYDDPRYDRRRISYLVLIPLQREDENGFGKADDAILNTPLLERLSVLYGLYAAPVEEAFRRDGRQGAWRELSDFFSDKEGVSLWEDGCALGLFDPYPCLSYDAWHRFSLSPLSSAPSWDERPAALWDKEALSAVETAKRERLSLLIAPEGALRREVATELVARAMAAGRRVTLISDRWEQILNNMKEKAQGAQEEPTEESLAYFDQLFFVHPHGYSFYHAHLLWDQYSHAPEATRLPWALLEGKTPSDVVEWSKSVSDLTDAWERAGGVKNNPLRLVENPFYSEEYKAKAVSACQRAETALEEYLSCLEKLWERFSLEGELTPRRARLMDELLGRLEQAREVASYYYECRNDPLSALVEMGHENAMIRARLQERFFSTVFALDAAALRNALESEEGFLRKRSGKKAAVQALRSCARPNILVNDTNVGEILDQLIRCKQTQGYLKEQSETLKRCFGVDLASPDGDSRELWTDLRRHCQEGEAVWTAYRRLEGAKAATLSKLCRSEETFDQLRSEGVALRSSASRWEQAKEELSRLLTLRSEEEGSLSQSLAQLTAMREAMDSLRDWTLWLQERARAQKLGLAGVVEQCESGRFDAEQLKLNFLCGFFRCVAEHIRSHSPALESFDAQKERSYMQKAWKKAEQSRSLLFRDALANGSLCCLSLRSAASATRKEPSSLLIVDGAEKLSAKEGGVVLAAGEQSVLLASPMKECRGSSLSELSVSLGAKEATLSLCYDKEPLFSFLAAQSAANGEKELACSAYPVVSSACGAEVFRVNGGYDEATGTNVIEASVIVDELLAILEQQQNSAAVVCFGEAQRKLVTLLLAKRLAEMPVLAARYLADPEKYVVCALGEEVPEADCVFVSLCFSCPHGKYGEGLSGKLAQALGENAHSHLTKLFFLPRKRLCFTVAFGADEVVHTRSVTPPMRVFSAFARLLFSLGRFHSDQRERLPLCDGIAEKIALAVEQKGYTCRKNAGFSSVGVPLVVEDPREEGKAAVAVIADETLRSLCADPNLAKEYLEGWEARGVKVFRLSALAWYCDREAVIRDLLAMLEQSVGDADSLIPEMTPPKTE